MTDLVKAIDKAYQAKKELEPGRRHLGASVIGEKCPRKIWYAFRRAKVVRHGGRLLRLFNRGHREEDRFLEYLTGLGIEVRSTEKRLIHDAAGDWLFEEDWDQPDHRGGGEHGRDVTGIPAFEWLAKEEHGLSRKQFGFVGHKGHFSGSCDGKAAPDRLQEFAPFQLDGWGLLEFKTSNDKSFKDLVNKGIATSKPGHYIQMQVYMHKLGLEWGLYMAVNKNDEDIYYEFVRRRPEIGQPYEDRAAAIIDSLRPPGRYSQDPSWFECKFCDFREICHYDQPMLKSCRTCAFGRPAEAGRWECGKFHSIVPEDFELKGCDTAYEAIQG